MTNDYIVRQIYRKYLTVSIMSMAAATLGMVVDGVVVGNFLGSTSLAALGLCAPLFVLFAAVAGIFSNGSVSVCANYIGRGEKKKVNEVFTVILFVTAILSVVIAVLTFFGSAVVANLLGAEGALLDDTVSYVQGLSFGAVPIIMYQVVLAFARTDGSPSLGLLSVIGMTAVNVFLDLFNVFVLHWGMTGMALATTISYVAAAFIACSHFAKKNNTLRIVKSVNPIPALREVMVTGTPNAVNKLCNTLRGVFLNNMLGILGGSVAITALSVQGNLNGILGAVSMGVGATTLLVSGIFYGEEDRRTLKDSVGFSLKLGLVLTGVLAVLGIIFVKPLIRLYTQDAEVVEIAVRTMVCYLISLPLNCVNVVFLNYYQSSANLLMANLVCIGNNLLFMVLPVLALSPVFGLNGVWISFIIAELITIVFTILLIRFKSGKWPFKLEDLLLLRKDFGVSDENQVDVSLSNNMEDIIQLSVKIERFCKKHLVDVRRTYFLSLCIEEMAGNVVEYAFGEKDKEHFIDIKVMYKDGDLIFRMRDDGKPFNPLSVLDESNEGVEKNIGIRMVSKICRNIDYRNTVGMNNLIIKL